MQEAIDFINQVGFPIASALGLGFFIWKLINKIIDGMEKKIDVVDEKVDASLNAMEERLSTRLDSQYGIIVALIDRVRSLDNQTVRQDVLLKTLLGIPNLIEIDKVSKADREDQRKD